MGTTCPPYRTEEGDGGSQVTPIEMVPTGKVMLRWEFIYDGGKMPGGGDRGDMFINNEQVASGRITDG